MDYLVLVQIIHPSGDLLGPLHQLLGRHLLAVPEQVEEGAVGAVLHHDTEHGGLDADAPENVPLVKRFPKYFTVNTLNT